MGRGPEPRHLRLPRRDPVSRGAARANSSARRPSQAQLGIPQEGRHLLLPQRRPPEPARALGAEGPRGNARGRPRPEHLLGRRDGAPYVVQAQPRRAPRRLRDDADRRLRLARAARPRPGDASAAARPAALGALLEDRLARRRLLLQPLSRAGQGQRAHRAHREPVGLVPPHRHAAGRRRARVRRHGPPAPLQLHRDHRGRALRGAIELRAGPARQRRLGARREPGRKGIPRGRRRDRQRPLRARHQRRQPAAVADDPRRAERATGPGRPGAAGRRRLDDGARRAACAARGGERSRRPAVRELPAGRRFARRDARARRRTAGRRRAARPRQRDRLRRRAG